MILKKYNKNKIYSIRIDENMYQKIKTLSESNINVSEMIRNYIDNIYNSFNDPDNIYNQSRNSYLS